jgi:Cu/Ag efflux protein CusF
MNRFLATAALIVAAQLAVAASPMTDGEVKKVDKAAARITLKHGEIKSLDIPAMTMAYRVKDPAMLDKVQPGQHVRFSVERIDSQYTVVQLEPAQ